jgi:hypothetical protein
MRFGSVVGRSNRSHSASPNRFCSFFHFVASYSLGFVQSPLLRFLLRRPAGSALRSVAIARAGKPGAFAALLGALRGAGHHCSALLQPFGFGVIVPFNVLARRAV